MRGLDETLWHSATLFRTVAGANTGSHWDQGHSKIPPSHGLDSLGAVFAEVLTGFTDGLAAAPDDAEGGVADARERPGSGADSAAILIHRHVANVMELVLDGPMGAVEREQPRGRCLGHRQAGDQINGFGADLAADLARPRQPRNLGEAGPIEMRHSLSAGFDPTCFNAAVRLARGLCAGQIRRRSVVDAGRV